MGQLLRLPPYFCAGWIGLKEDLYRFWPFPRGSPPLGIFTAIGDFSPLTWPNPSGARLVPIYGVDTAEKRGPSPSLSQII